MKDISVVIPVYNGAELLEDCVKSVYAAGKLISEIIIVDDGSTDETLEKAYSLRTADGRIRVIHTENHGCYSARRTGIKASKGSYIAFIDVDDRYIPKALDMLTNLLEEYDADVAMGSYTEVRSYEMSVVPNESNIQVLTADHMWLRIMKWKTQEFVCYVWNKLYKRELLLDLIDAEGINQGEDVLITCQAFLDVQKIVETTAPVYMYYQNPGSLTRTEFGQSDLDLIRVWDSIVEIMREKRPELLYMAQFNRWRTDFTLICRLIIANNKNADEKYAENLKEWREGLKYHWKDLISPDVMPRNRELLVIGLRFFFFPVKVIIRLSMKMMKQEAATILHRENKKLRRLF